MVYQNPKINSLVDVISVPITIMHRSARSLNIPPAPPPFQRNARASDRRRYLGGGEFEPCLGEPWGGEIEPKVSSLSSGIQVLYLLNMKAF